ncbi:ABC-2 type transport system permease protein [Paenibacillus endophyticus]|uniref:ABC-2 type transport system permease protein n=1 Tax=Paenibacillus endophyticus TaxID=1294268 RepID=A0A7W5CAN4_9BACL|nr:ABC-2 family transporter protein [Paenibacillus endophyticus]MBB3154205.1 ABC-2 type transport system permease protein [Paenibacillus endophyticus]
MSSYETYNRIFKLGMQSALEYRMDLIFSLLSAFFPIMIQYFIWSAVYADNPDQAYFGYSYHEMIMYTIFAAFTTRIVMTHVEHEMALDIKDGHLNRYLVRPINYFSYRFFNLIGQKMFFNCLMVCAIFAVLICYSIYNGTPMKLERFLLFLAAVILAFILNMLISYAIAAIAFWLSEISYFFEMTGLFVIIISGGMFPVDIFGPWVNAMLDYSPFKLTIYFAANVVSGRLAREEIIAGIGMQGLWIISMYILSRILWRIGMKRYLGLGG